MSKKNQTVSEWLGRGAGSAITPAMIIEHQKKVAMDRMLCLKIGSELTPVSQLPANRPIPETTELRSLPKGTVKGASLNREKFIKAQVASVAEVLGERYGQAVMLASDLQYVVLPRFSLPRRWGMKSTPILIWFPNGYPEVPPHGFYLSNTCKGPHILQYNVYGDSPNLSAWGWNWYCVNPKGWLPDADPLEGDNLWTFLDLVRASLTIDEF